MPSFRTRSRIVTGSAFLIACSLLFSSNLTGAEPARQAVPEVTFHWSEEVSFTIYCVAFSPDGKHILAGGRDGEMRLWETRSGKQVRRFKAPAQFIHRVGFTPDGRHVFASGDYWLFYQSWDARTGKEIQRTTEPGEWFPELLEKAITRLAYPKEPEPGSMEWAYRGLQLAMLHGNLRGSYCEIFALSRNSRWGLTFSILKGSESQAFGPLTIRIWDFQNGKEVRRIEEQRAFKNTTFGHFATGFLLFFVTPGWENLPTITDQMFFEDLHSFVRSFIEFGPICPGDQNRAVLSSDGRQLFSAGRDGNIRCWDLETGRRIKRLSASDAIDCLALSPDEKLLATGGREIEVIPPHRFAVRLWDIVEGKTVRFFLANRDSVQCLAFSPDGKRLLSGCQDGSLHLWEVATGKEIVSLKGRPEPIHAIAFSPNGTKVLSGGEKFIQLWRLNN